MAKLAELFQSLGSSVNTMTGNLRSAELENKMEEDKLGVSGTDVSQIPMGVLNALDAMSGNRGQLALDYANQAIPMPEEANKYEAALRFFLEMGKQASQPGSTVLGSAFGAGQAPLDYLTAKNAEIRKAKQARASLGLQIAPSLKPKAVGKAGYTNVMVDGVAQVMTSAEIQAAKKAGKTVSPYEKTTGTAGKVSLNKYLDPSRIDDPETKTVNEQIIQLTPAEYQARMAANNPVYPLAATDSALSDPVDTSLGKAKKTVIYGNGTTLTTYDSGTVLRTGGSNEPVAQADFERVMNEAREAGITDTIRGSAAAEAGRSAVEIGVDAQKSIGKLTNSIELLKKARVLVDLPVDGANTGWLESKFPSVFASSIALDNIRSNLGLAVVGMNTFGALSEGELELALATALPNTMQEEELSQWISDKIVAQEKLRIHYAKAAEYLTDPLGGGISKWVEIQRNKFEVEQGEEARRAADVITNMSDEDFRTITAQDKMAMTTAELQAYLARLQGQ